MLFVWLWPKGFDHLGSHDINYMALSGVLAQMKDGDGRPIQPSMTFADLVGGISASEAIVGHYLSVNALGKVLLLIWLCRMR